MKKFTIEQKASMIISFLATFLIASQVFVMNPSVNSSANKNRYSSSLDSIKTLSKLIESSHKSDFVIKRGEYL